MKTYTLAVAGSKLKPYKTSDLSKHAMLLRGAFERLRRLLRD